MDYDLLLFGGTLYSGRSSEIADVAIKDGRIAAVGALSHARAAETIDLSGLAVLPGAIDTQVHFREPGMEHKEDIATGTQSAVLGGVTTVLEMPNTNPPTLTEAALNDKLGRARGRSWCHIAFFVGAAAENVEDLARLENLPGTPGIKIFMGSSTGSLLVPDDETLRAVLKAGRKRTPVHAEDFSRLEERKHLLPNSTPADHPFLRDAECARLATERILRLSGETGRPVHVLHVSTADELPLIAKAKEAGLQTTAEVTPQHLFFSAPGCYEKLGSLAQMNPPIRSAEHRGALRAAVKSGLFDVVGSDHAPHTLQEKALAYPKSPSGMPGVQTLLPVMLTLGALDGLLSVSGLVRLACENPARIYGIHNKGFVREGYDADLAIVDLNAKWKVERSWIKSKCGWSPYEGEELAGRVVHTLVGGQFAVRDGELNPTPHGGVPRFEATAE